LKLVAIDAGGTHVRFAIAELADGERPRLGPTHRYRSSDYPDLPSVWRRFAADAGEPLPPNAAIGVAAPIGESVLRFVNSPWTIDTRSLPGTLGLDRLTLLNDFGAIAHAVPGLRDDELEHVHGPEGPLPQQGVTSVIGPGTGLGVAMLIRRSGDYAVVETEGAHIGFAPCDAEEDALVRALRSKHGRVSVERIVSGPGLSELAAALGKSDTSNSAALWEAACSGTDPIAAQALDRFLLAFGSAAGDLALAHGSNAVVIAGALANRILDRLRGSPFGDRFEAKGRYRRRMEGIPVKVATHPDPGLLGAAIAFQREHLR